MNREQVMSLITKEECGNQLEGVHLWVQSKRDHKKIKILLLIHVPFFLSSKCALQNYTFFLEKTKGYGYDSTKNTAYNLI